MSSKTQNHDFKSVATKPDCFFVEPNSSSSQLERGCTSLLRVRAKRNDWNPEPDLPLRRGHRHDAHVREEALGRRPGRPDGPVRQSWSWDVWSFWKVEGRTVPTNLFTDVYCFEKEIDNRCHLLFAGFPFLIIFNPWITKPSIKDSNGLVLCIFHCYLR